MRRPKQGDVFTVSLGDGLPDVVGVIARKKGPLHLVYTFLGEPMAFRPEEAFFVGLVGSQGFADESWRLRGPLPGFAAEGWPVPRFGRLGIGLGTGDKGWLVVRDDSLHPVETKPASREEAARLPSDDVHGSGAAMTVWRKLARQVRAQRPAA